tara:strand:+ start:9020 stop:12466 length:3447 start_codon:yes stop_codon:yes gene_type:complete
MTITSKDVLFYQAQDNTDNVEGGGYRSPVLIQDGVMNNLFNDISRLDAVGGDLNMRKVIRVVNTDDRSLYQGSHAIIRKNPSDPKVGAIMIHDPDPFSTRADVVELLESYTSPSSKTTYYLEGTHIVGIRTVTFVQLNSMQITPYVGQVLVLSDSVTGISEYIKIKSVATTKAYGYSGGTNFTGTRATCEITEPLSSAFIGYDFTQTAINSGRTEVRTTATNENLEFYGTEFLAVDVAADDVEIEVGSIRQPLIPTDSIRSTVVTQTFVEDVISYKTATGIPRKSIAVSGRGVVKMVGNPILAGSITSTDGHADNAAGDLIVTATGAVVALVDYPSGTITTVGDINTTLSYNVGVVISDAKTSHTERYVISDSNQGTLINFNTTKPVDNAGYIQYRNNGVWYRAEINSDGSVSNDFMTGSVTPLNNNSSTVLVTLSELPDIGSYVIITYASDSSVSDISNQLADDIITLRIDLPDKHIIPTGFELTLSELSGDLIWTESRGITADDATTSRGARAYVDWANGVINVTNLSVAASDAYTGDQSKMSVKYYIDESDVQYTTEVDVLLDRFNDSIFRINNTTIKNSEYFEVSAQFIDGHHEIEDIDLDDTREIILKGSLENYGGTYGLCAYIGEGGINPYLSFDTTQAAPSFQMELVDGKRTISVAKVNYVKHGSMTRDVTGKTIKELNLTNTSPNTKLSIGLPFSKIIASEFKYRDDTLSMVNSDVYVNGVARGTYVSNLGYASIPSRYLNPGRLTIDTNSLLVKSDNINSNLTSGAHFIVGSGDIKPESVSIKFVFEGVTYTANSDSSGDILVSGIVQGTVNSDIGVVNLGFNFNTVDITTLTFSAQSETSISSSKAVTGINAVRMPSDGMVDIFKAGNYIVIFDEVTTAITTPSAGTTVTLDRNKQAYIEVIDVNGERLNNDAYTADRLNGSVTFSTPLSLVNVRNEPLTAPYSIVDRVEDMATIRNVLSNGVLQLSSEITRDYTAGVARVASCLVWGDSVARLYNIFSQSSVGSELWSDIQNGSDTTAQYNNSTYPMQVVNADAIPGRFMIQFRTSTSVDVIHENMGIISAGINLNTDDVAPINPVTGKPIFVAAKEGFGSGWSTGNIIRLNIEAADDGLWIIRPVQPGALNENEELIEIESRGDSK